MLNKSEARKQVRRIRSMPTLPDIVIKIIRTIENPDSSSADVARLIAQDQVLSARVLRMANSAYFGMSRKISSITQALVLLGFDVVKGLVLSSAVSEIMKKSMDGLWEHSIGCAAAAGEIARTMGRKDAEEILLAGLLHDLGKVVLALQLPEETSEIIAAARSGGVSFYEAESSVLAFNHVDVGLWLAEHWNLPVELAEPMCFHHQPEKTPNAPAQAAIVHLADIVVRAAGFGSGGDPFVPPLSPEAWAATGLNTSDFRVIWKGLLPKLDSLREQES